MEAKQVQQDIYQNYINERERREEKKSKQSFWASDFGDTLNELFWAWTNVPATNPPSAETLSMFDIGKLCELHVIRRLQETGFAADLESEDDIKIVNEELERPLVFAEHKDEFGHRQIRMEMEREYVPITGYLDGITLKGEPIEVKSTRSHKLIREIALGQKIGNDHYIGQLAIYMDFLGKSIGWLVVIERSNGTIMIAKVEHLGNGIYSTTDVSLGLPEEDAEDAPDIPVDLELVPTVVDLHEQYKRWRYLFEEHIHPNIEPPLEFEYKPFITTGLLEGYLGELNDDGKRDDKKIRSAIKGNRILSAHGWKPQYCNWKNLWVEKECMQKGFGEDVATFLKYGNDEIELMLEFIDCFWIGDRIVKRTDSLESKYREAQMDKARPKHKKAVAEQRRKAGIEDSQTLDTVLTKRQASLLSSEGICVASQLDSVKNEKLMSIKGVGEKMVIAIRAETHTYLPEAVQREVYNTPIPRNWN